MNRHERQTGRLRVVVAIIACITSTIVLLEGNVCAQEIHEPQLRALEAQAVCVALQRFRSDAPKADLRFYAILVNQTRTEWDVCFLPDRGPGEKWLAGGETSHGAEVHYILSRPS